MRIVSHGFNVQHLVQHGSQATPKVAFPAYQTHVLYDVMDQPDIKEIREAYINAAALKGIRPGQLLPSGTVLSLPTFKARVDDKGEQDFVFTLSKLLKAAAER